ncbi:phage portal protein [Pelagibacterium halotolerans]|nr:phage portal protein [Pelagibacterium halotolerans]
MRHAGQPIDFGRLLKRTRFDYRKEIGDGLDSSVVTAPIQWIQRAVPEARLTVQRRKRDGSVDEVADHKMLALIARPNKYYGDIALWSGTLFSYLFDGNGYWLKMRNGLGRPAELWYVPHWTMEPRWPEDGSEFISHYRYTPGNGMQYDVAFEDVVHFRHGIDPRNPRKGISPIGGALREIFMDLESSNFVASLLRNMGVPGVVISPKGGVMPTPEDVAATKAWFGQAFGGDRRGSAMVMGAPTEVSQFGFNPQQMNMSEARDIAEERICAELGIPAAVVGFGSGLQQTKVGATMAELIKLAWQNGVLPVLRVMADELDRSLLPDFGTTDGLTTKYDTSEVSALQDDLDKLTTRMNTAIAGGWAEVADGREALGLDVDDSHRIYLRNAMMMEVPAGAPARVIDITPEAAKALENKARATPRARRRVMVFIRALDAQVEPLSKSMERRLKGFFAALAKDAAKIAKPILDAEAPEPKDGPAGETKSDTLLVERILDGLGIAAHRTTFQKVYEAHYVDVARKVSEAAGLTGIDASLPDPVARAVAGAGGRRAGLIDLGDQTREALFDAIAVSRSEGEGIAQMVSRIAAQVESGPWASPESRARTIARTETKYAQNVSTLARAKAANVVQFVVFDGRLGPGRSDADCIARDGTIVSAEEAEAMAADEHPNGTLSFAPYFGED